jgi:effector-binding domain-containing protein
MTAATEPIVTVAPRLGIELVEVEEASTVVVPLTGATADLPRLLGAAFALSARVVDEDGAEITGPPFARYYSFEGGRVEAEAGFPYTGELQERLGIRRSALPGGLMAVTTHAGPYDTLVETYAAAGRWIEEQGLRPAGAPWEVYLSEPDTDPASWQTLIYQPVDGA